ncbi:MAG: ankyrin repeat domain-containing protein [Burkholderiaceae bacterium]
MNFLRWYLPLDSSTSLDEVCSRWRPLLEQHHLNAGAEDPRYEDAILSFLANSRLPAALKLGAVLTCVSSADLDLRLALGLLDEELEDATCDWPAIVEEAMAMTGPCLAVATSDPWLSAFAAGRLAGLRDTLGHDGTTAQHWCSVFWHKYLGLACRWADREGVQLALQHGAQVQYDRWTALVGTVEGAHAHALRTPYYTEGRRHTDYREILHLLVAAGVELRAVSDIVLPAAAAVDNVDMLQELAAQGADLQVGGQKALLAAASNFAASAVDWLLSNGVSVHADGEAALIGAVGSLDEPMVEILLAAGADVHAADQAPLCTAAQAQPADMYNGEDEFVGQRADMIALLLRNGADGNHPAFVAALTSAAGGREVLDLLTDHEALNDDARAALAAILAAMPAAEQYA